MKYKKAIRYYQNLLNLLNIVQKNYGEKSINNILDYASNSDSIEFLEQFYEITLTKLEETKNDVINNNDNNIHDIYFYILYRYYY